MRRFVTLAIRLLIESPRRDREALEDEAGQASLRYATNSWALATPAQ